MMTLLEVMNDIMLLDMMTESIILTVATVEHGDVGRLIDILWIFDFALQGTNERNCQLLDNASRQYFCIGLFNVSTIK